MPFVKTSKQIGQTCLCHRRPLALRRMVVAQQAARQWSPPEGEAKVPLRDISPKFPSDHCRQFDAKTQGNLFVAQLDGRRAKSPCVKARAQMWLAKGARKRCRCAWSPSSDGLGLVEPQSSGPLGAGRFWSGMTRASG